MVIRFVLVRDPEGKLSDAAFLWTDLHAPPEQILHWVVRRWAVEGTFEEARALVQGQTDAHSGEELVSTGVRLATERLLQEA